MATYGGVSRVKEMKKGIVMLRKSFSNQKIKSSSTQIVRSTVAV